LARKSKPLNEDVEKRLARVAGHAVSLKKMWEDERDCDEMLTQISAVRAALDQVGKVIFAHHIEHRVIEAVESGKSETVIKDLKAALDRFK
jgi:DNA-binding FrmR family transcriptional regulator